MTPFSFFIVGKRSISEESDLKQLEYETPSVRRPDSYCRHLSPDSDLKPYETSSRYGKEPLNMKSYLNKG